MFTKCAYISPAGAVTAFEVLDTVTHARYIREGWRHYSRWLVDQKTRTCITVWERAI